MTSAEIRPGSTPSMTHGLVPWVAFVAYAVALLAVPSDIGLRAFGVVVTPSRVVLVVALAVIALLWLRRRTDRIVPRSVALGWVLFLGAALITLAITPSREALARFGSLVLEGPGAMALAIWVVGAGRRPERAGLAIGAVTALVAAVTVGLAAVGLRYDTVIDTIAGQPLSGVTSRFGIERQEGPFPSELMFAIWLAAATLLLLPATDPGGRRWRGRVALLPIGCAIVLTVSRIAITLTPLLSGVYFAVRRRYVAAAAVLVLAVVLGAGAALRSTPLVPAPSPPATPAVIAPPVTGAVVAPPATRGATSSPYGSAVFAPPPAPPPTTPVVDPEDEVIVNSGLLRVAAARASTEALVQRPLFGWGHLSARAVVSRFAGADNYVDSSLLSMLVELGLVGTVAFIVLVGACMRAAVKRWRDPDGLALLLAMTAILAGSLLASFFSITQGYAGFWLIAGLAVAGASQRRDDRQCREDRSSRT